MAADPKTDPGQGSASGPDTPIREAIGTVPVPGLGQDACTAGLPLVIRVQDGRAEVELTLGFPAAGFRAELEDRLAAAIRERTGLEARVRVDFKVVAHAVQGTLAPLPGVRNVIAVASGKGGVGKSTTAVNLALALARDGARVGILDADVYGPSQPRMLGLLGQMPESRDGKTFEPLVGHGLEAISIGFIVEEERPVVWRGPMVTQALSQLLFQTNWHDLDYLVVDLPPGTGDTQLTLTQKVPVAGAIVVTTPQDIALQDARKGLRMFEKVGVPVLGIVENMSTFICPCCGTETAIFGAGGGERLAAESGTPLLARLPLDVRIREEADGGRPTVVADPEGPQARRYLDMARRAAALLSLRPRDLRGKFGSIVVEGGR
jgi:ATP-binding protein involved in chromosome partitioning